MSSSPKQKSLLRLKSLGNNFLKKVPVIKDNDVLRNYRFGKIELTKKANKVPITKKNALRIPFRKQERTKKTEVNKNNRSIAHNNNNTNRVTIKRGIFPNMIRSKCIKRQLFNRKNHDNLSSSSLSSDRMQPDLPSFNRIGHVRHQSQLMSDDSSTPPIRLDATKKKKVDVLLSDSPFLLQMTNRSENIGGAGDEPLEESRPLRAALRTPENSVIKKTDKSPDTQWALSAIGNNYTTTNDLQAAFQKSRHTEVEIRKQEYEEIRLKVAQVEPLNHPKEAELIYWYEQYTECIKRVIIVERERNFEKFPDALETIKGKLHKLRTRRLEETSRQSDEKVDTGVDYDPDMFTPENDDGNAECVPMTVDETIKTPQLFFRTPSPLPKIQPKIDERRPVPDETRNKIFPIFKTHQNAQKVFNNEREKNRNVPQNDLQPPVMIRKVVEPTVIKTTWVASLPQEIFSDFSLHKPSFNIADTIDQNAGLAGIEYLKNVTNSKTKSDNRQVGNQHDKNWWRVVTSADKLRDDDRKTIDDDLPPWSQLRSLPGTTTTSAEAKFDLPHKTSKRKDTRDCLPDKKPANFLDVGNRDKDFRFEFATNLFDQQMTKYDRSIGDEDKVQVKGGNNSRSQRPLPDTTTSNTKAQFNFPRKTDKRKDTRDCLPDKRRSYSQGVGDRDDDFCFDMTTNMFKERMKQYCPMDDDDDPVEIEVQDMDNARIVLPFPETNTTSTKAQFDLPRKTDKRRDNTRDCLLDKRHKNFVGAKNRDDDFCPDITTNMFKERMKYYSSIIDDDDDGEKEDNSLMF